jgi:hypothetical protein
MQKPMVPDDARILLNGRQVLANNGRILVHNLIYYSVNFSIEQSAHLCTYVHDISALPSPS